MRLCESKLFGNTLEESDRTLMRDAFEFFSYDKELADLKKKAHEEAQRAAAAKGKGRRR